MNDQAVVGDEVRCLIGKIGVTHGLTYKVIRVFCEEVWFYDDSGYENWLNRGDYEVVTKPYPKFQELPDVEKGSILLAIHEGREIQYLDSLGTWRDWRYFNIRDLSNVGAYRIKPKPAKKTTKIVARIENGLVFTGPRVSDPTHQIVFDTIDNEPVLDSIRMVKI